MYSSLDFRGVSFEDSGLTVEELERLQGVLRFKVYRLYSRVWGLRVQVSGESITNHEQYKPRRRPLHAKSS